MTYALASKAKRKAMGDDQHSKTNIVPPTTHKASDADVALLQALLNRRHQHESNGGGGALRKHHQLAPRLSMVHPNVNNNESAGPSRPQQIAMILAAALQQQEVPAGGGSLSSAPSTMTVSPFGMGLLDTSNRSGTFQDHLANFPLPMKLYTVLSTPKFEHILSWQPHGRAFKIQDLDLFCAEVLPIFLNGSSFRHFHGFVSLLNLWGFRQFTKIGLDTSAFFHQAFLRGHPSLLPTMGPLPQANRIPLHDPSAEPNLYALPPLSNEKKPSDEQQVNLSMLSRDLLQRVVESRLPAVQGLRDLHPGLFGQQQLGPANYSRANLFPTNTASAPAPANLSSLQTLRAMEGLLAAKQVHDSSLLNFDRSSSNNNNNNNMQMLLPGLLPQSAVAPAATTSMHVATVTTKSEQPVKGKQGGAGGKKAKKPRRKWLPPLGPATPASKAMAMTKFKSATASKSTKQNAATTTTTTSDDSCDWLHTSAEAFAALANSSATAHLSAKRQGI